MRKKHHTKLVHEGNYVAEVDIEIIKWVAGMLVAQVATLVKLL